MPHIDDGTLHAWLDGAIPALAEADALPPGFDAAGIDAHLRACADCRARLEAERAVRERAGLVLQDAALPAFEAPPFEQLARTAAPPGQARRWVPLAWAASIVLALGAGWWGSALLRSEPQRIASERLETSSRDGARTAGSMAGQQAADEATAGAADQAANAGAGLDRRPLTGADAGPGVAEVPAVAAAESAQPGRETAAGARAAAAESPAAVQSFAQAEPAAAPAARRAPHDADAAAAPPAAAPPAGAPLPPPSPAAAAASSTERARVGAVTADPLTQAQIAAARDAVRRADAGSLDWMPLPAGRAEPVHGQILVVRDGGQPSVEMASPLGGTLVRVRQRLPGGELIELYTWQESRVALQDIVVTGSAARRDQAGQRAAAGEPTTQLRSGDRRAQQPDAAAKTTAPAAPPVRAPAPAPAEAQAPTAAPAVPVRLGHYVLPNGEHELIARIPGSGVLVLLRGDVPLEILQAVSERLVPGG